jgi:hypothetical protein
MFDALCQSSLYKQVGRVTNLRSESRYTLSTFINLLKNTKTFKLKKVLTNQYGNEVYDVRTAPIWSGLGLNYLDVRHRMLVEKSIVDFSNPQNRRTTNYSKEQNQVQDFKDELESINNYISSYVINNLQNLKDNFNKYISRFGLLFHLGRAFLGNTKLSYSILFSCSDFSLDEVRPLDNDISNAIKYCILRDETITTKRIGNEEYIGVDGSKTFVYIYSNLNSGTVVFEHIPCTVLWPIVKRNYPDIFPEHSDGVILARHLTYTFEYPHFHYFTDWEDFCLYQVTNGKLNAKAQIDLSTNGISAIEKRGCYGMICNSEPKLQGIWKYINIMIGHPYCITSYDELPLTHSDMVTYYNDTFKDKIDDLAYVANCVGEYYKFFFMSKDLYDCLIDNGVKCFNIQLFKARVIDESLVGNFGGFSGEVSNITIPNGRSYLPYDIGEFFCDNLEDILSNLKYKISGTKVLFEDIYNVPIGINDYDPDINDEQILDYYRKTYVYRKEMDSGFNEFINPQRLYDTVVNADFSSSLGPMDRLFLMTYVSGDRVEYTITSGAPFSLDVVILRPMKWSQPNNSSLKLLQLIFKFILNEDTSILLSPRKFLLLGSKDEPVNFMLRNINRGGWVITCVGDQAEPPNLRGTTPDIRIGFNYDYVISDLDSASSSSDLSDLRKFVDICEWIFRLAHRKCVLKIQYPLMKWLSVINNIMISPEYSMYKYGFYKVSGTKIGAIELFFVLEKDQTRDVTLRDSDLKRIISSFIPSNTTKFKLNKAIISKSSLSDMRDYMFSILRVSFHEERFKYLLGYGLSLCNKITYGHYINNDVFNDSGRITGMTSIDRLALFSHVQKYRFVVDHYNNPYKLEGSIVNDTITLSSDSMIVCLNNSQRIAPWFALNELIAKNKFKLNYRFKVHDIGCREYECLFYTMFDGVILDYVGYDTNQSSYPRDIYPLTRIVGKVGKDHLFLLAKSGNIIAFDSYFMNDQNDLLAELKGYIDSFCDGPKGRFTVISFYFCDPSMASQLVTMNFGNVLNNDSYCKFSLGTYDPVRALNVIELTEFENYLKQKGLSSIRIRLNSKDLIQSSLAYGKSVNYDSNYLINVFNEVKVGYLMYFV